MSYYYHIKGQKKNWEKSLFLTLETANIQEMLGNQVTIGKKVCRNPSGYYWNTIIYQTGTPINLAIVINESSHWIGCNNLTILLDQVSTELRRRDSRVYEGIDSDKFTMILRFSRMLEANDWEQEGF